MARRILSLLERNEFSEKYNEHYFYHSLFEKHKNVLVDFPNVAVHLVKDLHEDLFVFANGDVDANFIRDWLLISNNNKHLIAKNELDTIFQHDMTNSFIFNVNLVLREKIEEFEISTDKFNIIFRYDKILFINLENTSDFFSIESDYLVLWYNQFRL